MNQLSRFANSFLDSTKQKYDEIFFGKKSADYDTANFSDKESLNPNSYRAETREKVKKSSKTIQKNLLNTEQTTFFEKPTDPLASPNPVEACNFITQSNDNPSTHGYPNHEEMRDKTKRITILQNQPEIKLEEEKQINFSSVPQPIESYRQIALITESTLGETKTLTLLSTEGLLTRFNVITQVLKETENSKIFATFLREAEEILLKLKPLVERELFIKMEAEYQCAFQNLPSGPGSITQKDVDYLKSLDNVPRNVICENSLGEKFQKPAISITSLISHFNSLGFLKVMYSREVIEFDKVCDVFVLGLNAIETFFDEGFIDISSDKIEKLNHYFSKSQLDELGYASSYSKLVIDLQDRNKSKSFSEQGFHIYTILNYPKVIDSYDTMIENYPKAIDSCDAKIEEKN